MPTTMAVICSVALFSALVAVSFAGTVPNRAGLPVQSSHILPPQGSDKSPGRRIMNSAFANAGKTPGLEIWRIENFEPVAYPKNNFGKFYNGDSYIVLNTVEKKDKTFSWDVHFWLGADTSVDEAGAAAILTVQLDDLLNGVPVQHREVQDHESQLFLSYFKNGVRYEQGGVGTGFKHVETNAAGEKRLFQVKGKRNIRVRQVNPSISSMNKGDCFILDAGNKIYVYVGEKAKRVEKLKAISAANQIRDQDHNGRATVSIIDEFSSVADKEQFFNILGSGSASAVPEESTSEDDAAFERTEESATTLYRVTDANGKLKIDQISVKPLRQEMLESKDCFILDTGSGIYVWVGRGATQKEKSESMVKAQEFLRTKKYPAWTQIHRIVEGAESAPFKQYFATWRDVGMLHTRLVRSALGYDTDDSDFSVDDVDAVIKNLKKSGGSAIGFMPDKGQNEIEEVTQYISRPGTNEIMRLTVEYDDKLPILGFAAYIVPYTYTANNGETGKIIYVWEGVKATQGAKNKCFEEAMEMAIAENAILVRTVQNHEARHFLKIFKGNLMTPYTAAPVRPQLFRIRGTDETDVHASEVVCDSASLASTDVFALLTSNDHKIYIWVGLAASDFEKEMARKRFGNYWPDAEIEVIEEGAEPDDFWDDLQGEGQYDRSLIEHERPLLEPRLFHCRLVGKYGIQVEEVGNFEQEDLDTEDIMLVDAGDEIYMWVGSVANTEENSRILDMAKKYIKMEPTHRSIDTVSVIRVTQGSEPRAFKRMFPVWEDNHWQNQPSYEEAKKLLMKHFPREEDNDV